MIINNGENNFFKRIIYFLVVIQFFSCPAISQSVTKEDSLFVLSYINKSYKFKHSNIDSSNYYVDIAYQRVKYSNSLYLKTLTTVELAISAQNMAEYKKSAEYFREAIILAEKLNNKKLLTQVYTGFGNLFAIQKQYNQAKEYYNKAIKISQEINDTRKVSVILMNLANIEYNIACSNKNFRKCDSVYTEAYNWATLAQDTGQQIRCLGNWALALSDDEKFDASLDKLTRAIVLANLVNHESDLVYLYYYLGRTYELMELHEKAMEAFHKSVELAVKFKDIEFLSENYYCMAEANYAMGNYKEAFDYFKKYKSTEDTVSSKEIANELNAIKTKYDTDKKQQEIALLKANANKDRITKISLTAGTILLIFLGFLLLNRYRLKSKTNALLEKQNQIISEKNKDISDSINYAKKIQDAILPDDTDIQEIFPESFVVSLPKDVVSGDFYWCTQYKNYKLFAVADCTGHGVPGAFMSMIGNTLLNQIVIERHIIKPNLILDELRKEIIKVLKQGEDRLNKDGMDISIICIDSEKNTLEIACANNPVWIVRKDTNGSVSLIEIKPDKQPIGYISKNQTAFSLHTMQLCTDDVIYQFSDGYADQFGGNQGKKFKYNQLKELLVDIHGTSMILQAEKLKTQFIDWKGQLDQIDDVLLTGIKIAVKKG